MAPVSLNLYESEDYSPGDILFQNNQLGKPCFDLPVQESETKLNIDEKHEREN